MGRSSHGGGGGRRALSDSVDRGGRGGRGGRGDDDVIVVHLGSAGRRTADGGGRGGGGGGLFCGWLRLRTFSRDVPSITAAVAFLAGRVQRPSVGSGTVPGDVALLQIQPLRSKKAGQTPDGRQKRR